MSEFSTPADARLAAAAAGGCEESRRTISRRRLMGVTAGLFSWAYMPGMAVAGSATDPRLLVVVLRGGMDGLNTVVPFGDPAYIPNRAGLAIPQTSTIQLDSFFGLHPALVNLGAMYQAGDAAVVHAVCVPRRNRSHFDAQDNLEDGLPDQATTNPTGWLNRLLVALPTGNPIKSLGAVEIGEAPLILRGTAPVLGWSPTWFNNADATTNATLLNLYKTVDSSLGTTLQAGLTANALALNADPGASQEDISSLQKAFRGAARLMGAQTGPRIAVLSVDGFDTHVQQGGATGELATLLGDLDTGLGDFKTALGDAWSQTAVVCVTEFGRTAKTNGDLGTDHGTGTVALLAGGAINGGSVFGQWPGLADANLFEGRDLYPTTDLRSVFKGLLQDHLGVASSIVESSVFPSSSTAAPAMPGLIKSSIAASRVASARVMPATAAVPIRAVSGIAAYRKANAG